MAWSSEEIELPDGTKVRINYDTTEGGRWCAVLDWNGVHATGVGDTPELAKADLIRKLGEKLGAGAGKSSP